MASKVWDKITYPFLIFNGYTAGVGDGYVTSHNL